MEDAVAALKAVATINAVRRRMAMSPRRSLPTSNGLVLVLPKCILVAALSPPTRCSTLQRYSRESGNVFYEVTRSLRTSAAEISVLARVLSTLERSAFAQPVQAVALRCRLAFLTCLV